MLQIVTPTGARPEAWALCMRWMARQDYAGAVRWIIVDDGETPQEAPPARAGWEIEILRPRPFWRPGQNTQMRNLRAGLELVDDAHALVIVEDDDHYSPGWLSKVMSELEKDDIVGQRLCRKYSLANRRARELRHPYRASLCATGMRGPGIKRLRRIVERGPLLIDGALWKPGLGRLFDGSFVVGIKCLPGRAGIDSGHRKDFGEIPDRDGSLLRKWIGDDARDYEAMMTKPTTREREIAVYASCYRSPNYAMGTRRKAAVQSLISTLPKGSLLDIGCGRGESLDFAQAAGHSPVRGTEVVPALLGERVTYAEAHSLPFEDGSFDHVTCWDVLEHLTEDDIGPALAEMWRVARHTITVSASERSDIRNGRELHISKRPAMAWLKLIRSVWPGAKMIGSAGASPMFQAVKAAQEIQPVRDSQHVLKAEAAVGPDATDREIPAAASPGVGPMGAGYPADEGPA